MTTDRTEYQRAYQNARQRALNRLAKNHIGEYAALLAEERATSTARGAEQETRSVWTQETRSPP